MSDKRKLLQISLMAGAVYFFAIAVVHNLGLKVPGLFIYYNIPSYQYQDDIISFLSFGWAAFFYAAARHPEIAGKLVVAAVVALLGLAKINLVTDFTMLAPGVGVAPFWFQFALLCLYVAALAVLSRQSRNARG